MDYINRGYLGSTKFWRYRNNIKSLDSDNRKLSSKEIKLIFKQLIDSINYRIFPLNFLVHNSMHIAHRDIKLQNILVGNGLIIKLCDFGISQDFKDKENDLTDSKIGTVSYHPPEIYLSKKNFFKNIISSQRGKD